MGVTVPAIIGSATWFFCALGYRRVVVGVAESDGAPDGVDGADVGVPESVGAPDGVSGTAVGIDDVVVGDDVTVRSFGFGGSADIDCQVGQSTTQSHRSPSAYDSSIEVPVTSTGSPYMAVRKYDSASPSDKLIQPLVTFVLPCCPVVFGLA